MILDLRQFEDFPAQVHLEEQLQEKAVGRDDEGLIENVEVELSIQHVSEEYFCQGTIKGQITLECARCLSKFKSSLSGKTDFIIRSAQSVAADEKDVPDDEDYVELRDDLTADIGHIVRQTLSLVLPMKPICNDKCLGLCPQCGVNRNETACDCKSDDIDERWEGLAGLSQN